MSQMSSPSPSTARFVNTSSSSSASSNQEKWKQYAIYAAAGVVGLGVVYAGYRYLSKPALPKSTKKKVKSASSEARSSITSSSTSTSTPTSGSSTPVTATSTSTKEKSSAKRMSNDELNSAIENVLTQMSTTGQFDTDDTTNQRILKQIQAMADGTEGYTSITILNAMKYLLQWDNAIASNEDAPPSRNSQAMKDMEMAWNLLSHIHITDEDVALDEAAEVEGSTVAERKADLTKSVHFTQLEIAQRLRDAVRLNAAFIQLTSHTSLNTDDLALAFTVAPVLGRWNDTRKLGNQIQEKQPQFIELIFHGAACQRSDIPDYSVLYDWSESESKRGDVALSDIHFQTFIIRGIRKNLESLHTEHIEAHEKQQLRHQIDMDEQKLGQQFVDLPEQTNLQLVRHGAFVHMPSLSMLLTVAGPIVGDRMRMRGWLDIREVPGFAPFKQEEEYDLTKGADDIWSGTYTISQSPLEPEHKRSMRMVFRLQLRLKPGPQPH